MYQASKPPPRREASEGADDDEDDEVEDDDGPLLTIQPSFNTLLVVLRDPKVRPPLSAARPRAPG